MDSFKRLAYNLWKTGRYASKLDLIAYMSEKYLGCTKEQLIKVVEDVLSHIDKYDELYKQSSAEQFFIELLMLLEKYHVTMYAGQMENDEDDFRIFFETIDGTFGQDCGDEIDPEAVNGFEECVDDNVEPRKYSFPAVTYFEQENIKIKK